MVLFGSKIRRWYPILFALLSAAAPPPPANLAEYIHEGEFRPGDYAWLRGAFDGADASEKAAYQEMVSWRQRCRSDDLTHTRAELVSLGVHPGDSLNTMPYHSLVCDQVASLPAPLNLRDWRTFTRDVAVVRPLAEGFIAAVAMGERAAGLSRADLRDEFTIRVFSEQTLRIALSAALGEPSEDLPLKTLTAQQRGIFVSEIAIALAARDHANTSWLKQIINAQGWPKRSEVGDRVAKMAWLLAQHADADPAFQIRALRLIEGLLASAEADPEAYAHLYDRVMLKVSGKQRYGTQLRCEEGLLIPEPLESGGEVDVHRRNVGMDSLAEFMKRILHDSDQCNGSG